MKKYITPTVIIVSLVSFFTDIASEMLYPIMPGYLQSIGYGVVAIGLLEGVAEAFAGISKVFFAHVSDVTGKRKIFLLFGYGISALAKPLIGFTSSIATIFSAKLADRIGKGVRTAPRDALLIAESVPEDRGKVFGFHRSIDTLGAVVGPLLGLLLLVIYKNNVTSIFYFAIIPGILAVITLLFLPKEKISVSKPATKERKSLRTLISFWKKSPREYKKLFIGFVLFSCINSTNMFLLVRVADLGFSSYTVIAVYLVFNLAYAFFSFPLGVRADRYGFKYVYLLGIASFAITYGLLGTTYVNSHTVLILLFIIYGIFGAVEDGIGKAWLSLTIDKEYKATGIGLYLLFNSLALLLASLGTAFLWKNVGGGVALSIIALLSVVVGIYFYFIPNTIQKQL
jgi:MFS family permease